MNEYTASNGVHVHNLLRVKQLDSIPMMSALREFFRAEADDVLGRWRSPDNPNYVVYRLVMGGVDVIDERNGEAAGPYFRDEAVKGAASEVAVAYFAAHPEPKPWHDAKAEEAWVLTVTGLSAEAVYVAGDFTFRASDHTLPIDDPRITEGRRIYPEVSA